MNIILGVLALIGLFILAVVGKVAVGLLAKEAEGRLDQLPYAVLRLARRRLPAEFREAIHDETWVPELAFIMARSETRPITRLWDGVRYSTSLLVAVGKTARAAKPSKPMSRNRLFLLVVISGFAGAPGVSITILMQAVGASTGATVTATAVAIVTTAALVSNAFRTVLRSRPFRGSAGSKGEQ